MLTQVILKQSYWGVKLSSVVRLYGPHIRAKKKPHIFARINILVNVEHTF